MADPATGNSSNGAKAGTPSILPRSLEEQLRLECEVMTKYALASGMKVPAGVVQALEAAAGLSTGDGRFSTEKPAAVGTGNAASALAGDPGGVLGQLVMAHEQLAQIVAPSSPRTLVYLATELQKDGFGRFLGPVRVVGGIMLCGITFLLAFIVLALTPYARSTNPAEEANVLHPLLALLLSQFYFLSAAGMGATFSSLFEANRYIVSATFDPRYKGYYWIKIVLGLTAGYILANLIPLGENGATLSKATLAMLGGFSGTVVYNILNKLASSVESMVQGDPQTTIAAQQTAAKARAAEDVSRAKVKQAAGLIGLQNMLGTGASNDEVQQRISQLVSDLGLLDAGAGAPVATIPQASTVSTATPSPAAAPASSGTAPKMQGAQDPQSGNGAGGNGAGS